MAERFELAVFFAKASESDGADDGQEKCGEQRGVADRFRGQAVQDDDDEKNGRRARKRQECEEVLPDEGVEQFRAVHDHPAR